MVTRGQNSRDDVCLVNLRVVISKIDVIRGLWGASASLSRLKYRFVYIRETNDKTVLEREMGNFLKDSKHIYRA